MWTVKSPPFVFLLLSFFCVVDVHSVIHTNLLNLCYLLVLIVSCSLFFFSFSLVNHIYLCMLYDLYLKKPTYTLYGLPLRWSGDIMPLSISRISNKLLPCIASFGKALSASLKILTLFGGCYLKAVALICT